MTSMGTGDHLAPEYAATRPPDSRDEAKIGSKTSEKWIAVREVTLCE